MSFLASLAMLTVLAPQGTPPPTGAQDATANQPGLLSPAERSTLRSLLASYLLEDAEYSMASGKDRDKASRSREKAKIKFEDAWKKAEAKGNVLGSMPDLRAVFENCFLVKQPSISLGQLRIEKTKGSGVDYGFFLPKGYKAATTYRTIWSVPGTAADGATWPKPADWFVATWDKSASTADTIFHVPMPPAGLELDPVPDFSRPAGEADEQRRIAFMWESFAEVLLNHNVDRARVYLDAGRNACGFALRFMTMFPDRFAAAVLRAPSEVDDIRLGSLHGLPILLLRTPATATVVDALKARLDEVSPNTAAVLDATDEYPHKAMTPQIEQWLQGKRRDMVPDKVVIEPNHDKYNRAYWVDIDVADQLLTAAADEKPRLEVQADRAANRITVKATGVERFILYLNDDLVDLDKEFTVVVNDKAFAEKKTRSFDEMRERMITRNDWDVLFPVMFSTVVPK